MMKIFLSWIDEFVKIAVPADYWQEVSTDKSCDQEIHFTTYATSAEVNELCFCITAPGISTGINSFY